MEKVTKNDYKNVIYISHGYGGKSENLEKITEILKFFTKKYPEYLFISPVNMWSSIYKITDYDAGLKMCLCLLQELADEMWVCDENYMNSKGCVAEICYCHEHGIPYKHVNLSDIKEWMKG